MTLQPWPIALPLLLLAMVLAAYWHRVLRMARKARLKTGKAANLWPAESTGRILRLVWVPIVVVWVGHPFLSAGWRSPPAVLRPLYGSLVASWGGFAMAAGCFMATRICWRRMGSAWRMGIDPSEKTPLVATGPFAYVRHPIYALSCLMMIA